MTYTYVWVISCPLHTDFFCRHYKKTYVINAVKAHVKQKGCIEIDPDDISREAAPSDNDYW